MFKKALMGLLILGASCSWGSATSNEAIFGASTAGLTGGILGTIFEDDLNLDEGKGALLGAGLGALAGGLWGSYTFSVKQEEAIQQLPVRRVGVEYPDPVGEALDAAIEDQNRATMWGRGEVKSWEERYLDHNENIPYQGF